MPGTGLRAHRAPCGGTRPAVVVASAALLASLACGRGVADDRAPAADPEIVVLEGAPEDIGRDHGRRLGERIRLLEERYLGALLGGDLGRAVAVQAAAGFRERLRPRHRAELDAMAEAAGLDAARALLANSFLDLLPSVGCSTVALPAAAAPDGVARFGRNLDFPALGVADGQSLVVVVKPAGRHAFAAVTWPGLVGVLSGINEHGLALANMEVSRPPRVPAAMPYALLYRTVLEECRTVDEALALLDREPRQTANNLMLMDASGARALVEITPEATVVRKAGDDEPLVATNHHRSGRDEPARCRRYDGITADAARHWGTLDLDAVRRILDRAGQGDLTLQSMVIEPRNLVLHLAVGKEATTREYRRIDLGAWLRK
ncbi:MAG: C45 family autoproteolytic acyltransferase/hydrolase [Planctomycetaceae bacterium]